MTQKQHRKFSVSAETAQRKKHNTARICFFSNHALTRKQRGMTALSVHDNARANRSNITATNIVLDSFFGAGGLYMAMVGKGTAGDK